MIFPYDEDDNELIGNRCEFIMRTRDKCSGIVSGSVPYCIIHLRTECVICGGQATHMCTEGLDCRSPLCKNRYCTTAHNIAKHINTGYMNSHHVYKG